MRTAKPYLMFLAITLLSTGLTAQPPVENIDPGGGSSGGGSCYTCRETYYVNTGATVLACAAPDPGSWGNQNCRIESYPEGNYCFLDGNACCVD